MYVGGLEAVRIALAEMSAEVLHYDSMVAHIAAHLDEAPFGHDFAAVERHHRADFWNLVEVDLLHQAVRGEEKYCVGVVDYIHRVGRREVMQYGHYGGAVGDGG